MNGEHLIKASFSLSFLLSWSLSPGLAEGIRFYHGDHAGSSTMVTDEDGQVTQALLYSPEGEILSDLSSSERKSSSPFYTGQEFDTSTELYDYGARCYDPVLSRFLSVDPIRDVTHPQDLNLYAYAWNNPLRVTDPSGREEEERLLRPDPLRVEVHIFWVYSEKPVDLDWSREEMDRIESAIDQINENHYYGNEALEGERFATLPELLQRIKEYRRMMMEEFGGVRAYRKWQRERERAEVRETTSLDRLRSFFSKAWYPIHYLWHEYPIRGKIVDQCFDVRCGMTLEEALVVMGGSGDVNLYRYPDEVLIIFDYPRTPLTSAPPAIKLRLMDEFRPVNRVVAVSCMDMDQCTSN